MAKSIEIVCDRPHVGNFFVDYIQDRPDDMCQVDAATGEEETKRSVFSRSIRLAKALSRFGLKPGDVIALAGMNHLDLHIPYYAGLMNGYPIAGVDPYFKFDEIKSILKIIKPKVAFSEYNSYGYYKKAADDLELDVKIITFKEGKYTMQAFIADYDDNEPEEHYKVAEFDPVKTYVWLVPTSGTTGQLKVAAISHSALKHLYSMFLAYRTEILKPALNLSGIQWVSALGSAGIMPYLNQIKIQTSAVCTTEHAIDIINKYKSLTKHPYVPIEGYGQTETVGPALQGAPQGPIGNCGKPMPLHPVKLVDPATGEVVTEPNKHGELWVSGGLFTEYYNNPEETKNAFSEDGWYKSGDLMYRDENDYYFFVERIKILIKYRQYHVYPEEIEELILKHKDVVEVCVTGVEHPDDGERAVACVMRRPGSSVTEEEIKELVASKF